MYSQPTEILYCQTSPATEREDTLFWGVGEKPLRWMRGILFQPASNETTKSAWPGPMRDATVSFPRTSLRHRSVIERLAWADVSYGGAIHAGRRAE